MENLIDVSYAIAVICCGFYCVYEVYGIMIKVINKK